MTNTVEQNIVSAANKKEYQTNWNKDHPEQVKEYARKSYAKRMARMTADERISYNEKLKRNNKKGHAKEKKRLKTDIKVKMNKLLSSVKLRAKKKGVPFSLTLETLPPIPLFCPILGVNLELFPDGYNPNGISLDRLIPSLGYIPCNVRWMSNRANMIKNDATPDELIACTNWVMTEVQHMQAQAI